MIYFVLVWPLGVNSQSQNITKEYLNQNFKGGWLPSQKPLNLTVPNGTLRLEFDYNSNSQFIFEHPYVNQAVLEFFSPKYANRAVILVIINLQQAKSNGWEGTTELVIEELYEEKVQSYFKCEGYYNININGKNGSLNPYDSQLDVHIQSTSCNFSMKGSVLHQNVTAQATFYALFLSVVMGLQILFAAQVGHIVEQNNNAGKLSLSTMMLCNVQDFFMTMSQFYFLMTQQQYYIYLIFPLFLSAVLSLLFDMRLVMLVWRAKYASVLHSQQVFRKKLTIFYMKFYTVMIGYLTLMFFFPYSTWSLLLPAFIILPQIVHNVTAGNKPLFNPKLMFGYLGLRLMIPLYRNGCDGNIFLIQPNNLFCFLWVGIYILQIFIIFLQHKFGPRFFVPKCLIPGYYNYYVTTSDTAGQQCPICLQNLAPLQSINDSLTEQLIPRKVTLMQTPCRHRFHPVCLQQWMDVRLECPSCRKRIPGLM